ncbi:enoyl-CoA hydratase/carnithine racemase (plasmid) [Phenylobacterium zucineum HLK1]|uniref:Enoyl-CoA hydratase/carnithine racemase n=1 Tax=Phenylobacterium zucineum (strain HLK1) TaxID=450851 RepID=B4RIT0_PHEZH|nr:enoyl-CoA hydratase-related protein [Phenylobacterium zucineum]ACG80255.1 enoyl-CoA hydratase/carnithine racemase [Phenylobacterium zucineum HLK1]
MTDYAEILYEVEGAVATITLNRPEALNALTSLTQAEVRHALAASERDAAVIGTVLTGAGRGFCSGVDMNALGKMSEAGRLLSDRYEHLQAEAGNPDADPNYQGSPTYFLGLRKPLVAAVNGVCAGLGFSYATFCDMRFMDREARIVSSFAPRGLVAEHGTSWMLPRLVGPSNALDILWSSRRIEAEEAHRMGWANRLCEPGQAAQTAQAYLRSLAGTSAPYSLMMMKKQVWRHLSRELGDAMGETSRWIEESLARADFKEGVASFVERRPPRFAKLQVE